MDSVMSTLQHGLERSTTTEWQEWQMTLWTYKVQNSGTSIRNKFFSLRVPRKWNSIPQEVKQSTTVNIFKRSYKNSDSIREMLMQDYQLQSLSELSSATSSLQRHPPYNSTWVPENYSTITKCFPTVHKVTIKVQWIIKLIYWKSIILYHTVAC